MVGNRDKLSGVFAPVVTPFAEDEPDYDGLRENLRKLSRMSLKGYLALGSNGEARALSEEEEARVLEVFAEEAAGKVTMVGTACESTHHTIRKSKRAGEMGFLFVSILTPGYFARQMDDQKLTDHYRRIADVCPVPVLLYNAPKFAGGVSLSVRAVMSLSEHGNIIGIKDSSPAGPGTLLTRLDPSIDFSVLAGSTIFFYPSLLLGAVGGVLSLADYLPGPCCRLYDLFRSGKNEEALDLHRRLVRINTGVSGTLGIAGVKAAMDLCGFQGGEPRRPLVAASDEERQRLKILIESEGFEVE